MQKKKIAIIFGGHSTEYEISLQSAFSVLEHINTDKYDILPIGITRDGEWYHYIGDKKKIADNKELKEVCLLEQVYVKAEDGKQTVAQYVAQVAKENQANLSVKSFVRFETGEGIEKKVDDFAAEVAAQAGL